MSEKPKIMYASEEAAQQVTVTGWQSRNGRFYGSDEHLARWDGCTHLTCECSNEVEKSWTKCGDCRDKAGLERYLALPFQEWDELTPLTLYDNDTYFWSKEEVLSYCEGENIKPEAHV